MMRRMAAARWPKILIVAMAAPAIVGVVAFRYWDPGRQFDVRGVDVSHHQGFVDWAALAEDDTAFAYIKSTEGGDWTDPRSAANWLAAGDAGLLRGAYHFFTLCTPGDDQAANMIATVPDEPGMLPPAVDLEFGGNCSARPEVDELLQQLDVFLVTITNHYRMRPVVYTNADFYAEYLVDRPPDVTWWIMSPVWQPWGSPEWTFWQYFPGYRAGVSGRIDRMCFVGNRRIFSH